MTKNIIIIALVVSLIIVVILYIRKKKTIDAHPYNPNDSSMLAMVQMKYGYTVDKDGVLHFADGTTSDEPHKNNKA